MLARNLYFIFRITMSAGSLQRIRWWYNMSRLNNSSALNCGRNHYTVINCGLYWFKIDYTLFGVLKNGTGPTKSKKRLHTSLLTSHLSTYCHPDGWPIDRLLYFSLELIMSCCWEWSIDSIICRWYFSNCAFFVLWFKSGNSMYVMRIPFLRINLVRFEEEN